jgi:hypothetical protein
MRVVYRCEVCRRDVKGIRYRVPLCDGLRRLNRRTKEDVHQWCRQLKQNSGWTQYPECINSAKQLLITYIDEQQHTASPALVPAAAAAVTPTRATLEIADQPNKRQKVDYTRCVDCSVSYTTGIHFFLRKLARFLHLSCSGMVTLNRIFVLRTCKVICLSFCMRKLSSHWSSACPRSVVASRPCVSF